MLPTNIAFRAPKVKNYDKENSDRARLVDVDSLEEERLVTCVRTAKYLEDLWRYYNRNVQERSFTVGDLVLRRKQKMDGLHKLSSHWEGPYIVKEVNRLSSYHLCDSEGIDIPNS